MVQRITGAAAPLILVDGTHLRFTPLTDRDTEEIDEWLSARVINTARQSFTPQTKQSERDELLAIAMRQAVKTTYTTPDGLAMLSTIPGMAFICWLSLRKEHPDFTVSHVQEILTDADNLDRANAVFRNVNGLGEHASKKVKRRIVRRRK